MHKRSDTVCLQYAFRIVLGTESNSIRTGALIRIGFNSESALIPQYGSIQLVSRIRRLIRYWYSMTMVAISPHFLLLYLERSMMLRRARRWLGRGTIFIFILLSFVFLLFFFFRFDGQRLRFLR